MTEATKCMWNLRKKKTGVEVVQQKTQRSNRDNYDENSGNLPDDSNCAVIILKVLEVLNEIKDLLEPGQKQINELHKLFISRPAERGIPKTLEEIRNKRIEQDIMAKKKKNE